MFELDSDPEVHKYLGNNPVKTIQESEKIIPIIRKQYIDNGIGRWAIIDKKSKEFIGWSGLKYETALRNFNYYDLGYRLKKEFWGKGIATETALAALKYGFEELNLKEICAAAAPENIASNKVIQKVGFSFLEIFNYEGDVCNWYTLQKKEWDKFLV